MEITNSEPKSLEEMITALTTTVNSIKVDITDLKNSKSNVSNLEALCSSNRDTIQDIADHVESDSLKIKLLTAIVIRQDNRIKSLEREMIELKKDSRKANLVISGIDETPQESGEEAIQKVTNFLSDQMEISDDIKVKKAVRMGKGPHHSLKIELENPDDKSVVFANASNLKGKENARKRLFFVSDDQLEHEREHCRYFQHLQSENKLRDEGERLTIQLKKGNLYINNDKFYPKVTAPSMQDILTLSTEELNNVKEVKLHEVGIHEEGDSEFLCYMQKVSSELDVQNGYTKMKIKHRDANHIVAAYHLEGAIGPYKQNFVDNNEHGAGWRMLESLKGHDVNKMAVYVARYHNNGKLGPRRFEIYKNFIKKVARIFNKKQSKLDCAKRLQRSNSQSLMLSTSQLSLDSINSQEIDHDENPVPLTPNKEEL